MNTGVWGFRNSRMNCRQIPHGEQEGSGRREVTARALNLLVPSDWRKDKVDSIRMDSDRCGWSLRLLCRMLSSLRIFQRLHLLSAGMTRAIKVTDHKMHFQRCILHISSHPLLAGQLLLYTRILMSIQKAEGEYSRYLLEV
jgi:hypothetical protein